MKKGLNFPEYVRKEGGIRPALEVSIDFLPTQFEGRWLDPVREFTSRWVRRKKFNKKGTLWMLASISTNLISRHPESPAPSLSEFIVQFGLPELFFDELTDALHKSFNGQAAVTEMLPFRREDGWTPICHIEEGYAWKAEDSPDDWVPVRTLENSRAIKAVTTKKKKK